MNSIGSVLKNMRYLVILIFVFINESYGGKQQTACSLEFTLIGSKCYHFSEESTNWNEAYYQCLSKNSSLAILKNSREGRQLRNYMNNHKQVLGQKNRWIGGKFDWKNNKWIWAETGQKISLISRWKMPENTNILQWACIIMNPNLMHKWTYKGCLNQNHYICEKKSRRPMEIRKYFDMENCKKKSDELREDQKKKCLKLVGGYGGKLFHNIPSPMIQAPKKTKKNKKEYVCPSYMFVLKNKCYYFSHEKLNWNDAYWACRDNKTYLAVVRSKIQNKILRDFLNNGFVEKHERWLGGLYDWKMGRWLWANSGKPIKYHGFPTKNFTGPRFEWRSMTIDPDLGNMWNARLRTDVKHYICQKTPKTMVKLGDFNTENTL